MTLTKETLDTIQQGKPRCASLAVRKLELCAQLLDDKKLLRWCNFHLGHYKLSLPSIDSEKQIDDNFIYDLLDKLKSLDVGISKEELVPRFYESGGGFESIEFVENTHDRLIRMKRNNDRTYYISHLQRTISSVSNSAYNRVSRLYKRLNFGEIPSRQFDVIRDRVDNLLLDICPAAIEKFMVAYERLASTSSEDWSLALTATRRVIKSVADAVYGPKKTKKGERKLGEEQYINRLWAFLDENATAGLDKDLAKAHINYLGSFLQRLNEKASKGVHAEVTYDEAVKAVLYTYLTLGDILETARSGFDKISNRNRKVDINVAPLEALEAVKGIGPHLAKEIIKARVKRPFENIDQISTFKGVGPKTMDKIRQTCMVYT